jgi:hypothetical protein
MGAIGWLEQRTDHSQDRANRARPGWNPKNRNDGGRFSAAYGGSRA